ncbi:MAG: FecR domain-containing protein [Gemmatimonadota bacterium]
MKERLLRYIQGHSGPDEIRSIERWMADDSSNEEFVRELREIWEATTHLAHETQEVAVPIERLLRLAEARSSKVGLRSVAGSHLAMPSNGRFAAFDGAVRKTMQVAAAVMLLLGAGFTGSWMDDWGPSSRGFGLEEIRTVTGEMATAELADGTVIRLAPNSVLRFDPERPHREVWLEGRAFFSVHHNPAQPFRVRTPTGDAVVLGTRFDMQVRPEGIQVAVVEGVVEMDAGPGPVRVEAGQVGRLTEENQVVVEASADILARLDWVGQFMAFERTPLTQVALEVERLYGLPVDIIGHELAARTVTGAYEGRTFEQTLEVICLVVGAHCQIGESGAVIQP